MNTDTVVSCVNNCIRRLCDDFVSHPNKLLTEDDMRMHLCVILLEHFGTAQITADGGSSIALHSEVRWYGNGRLKYRSDIVVIDVSTLSVRDMRHMQLPSKGYGFNVPKAIIELKFRRPTKESNRAFLASIENDCSKLRAIKSELSPDSPQPACWVVAFDKKADVSAQIQTSDRMNVESGAIRVDYRHSCSDSTA
ncbi:hypothetical protein [Ferrovum myxofaciens]|uniref:hypothetical protein n=1 Tax=Ferrovum myxofaciens TaxID=416213 RepID=UPI0004E0D613|nr:hypothetical protein [Ferrovum myxofaciens]